MPLTSFFKRTSIVSILYVIALFCLFWIITIARGNGSNIDTYATTLFPLSSINIDWFNNIFVKVIVVALLFWGIVYVNVALSSQIILSSRSIFFRALLYVVICSIGGIYQLSPILLSTFCLLTAIYKIVSTYNRDRDTASLFFESSFLIGLGSLFYSPLVCFGIIPFIGMYQTYSLNIREVVIAIIGLIAPMTCAVEIYYLLDKDIFTLFSAFYINEFGYYEPASLLPSIKAIYWGLIGILLIAMIGVLRRIKYRNKTYSFYFSLMMWMLIICAVLYFALPAVGTEIIFIAAIPASFLFEYFFTETRHQTITEIIFITLLLSPFILLFLV